MPDIPAEKHAAIFGPKDDIWGAKTGRQRKCKSCGDWHLLSEPWPHNCRPPKRNMQHLPAPQLIPDVPPHVHGGHVITTRSEQREFMKQNGLVEHEDFTPTAGSDKTGIGSRAWEEDVVSDIKRAIEEDPLNRPPPEMIEEANSHVTDDEKVDASDIEIFGGDNAGT